MSYAHVVIINSRLNVIEDPATSPHERDDDMRPDNQLSNITFSYDGEFLRIEFLIWEGNYNLNIQDNLGHEIASFTSSNQIDYFFIENQSDTFIIEVTTETGNMYSTIIDIDNILP